MLAVEVCGGCRKGCRGWWWWWWGGISEVVVVVVVVGVADVVWMCVVVRRWRWSWQCRRRGEARQAVGLELAQ